MTKSIVAAEGSIVLNLFQRRKCVNYLLHG